MIGPIFNEHGIGRLRWGHGYHVWTIQWCGRRVQYGVCLQRLSKIGPWGLTFIGGRA